LTELSASTPNEHRCGSPTRAGRTRHHLAEYAQSDSDNRDPSRPPRRSRNRLGTAPRSVPRDDRVDGAYLQPNPGGPTADKLLRDRTRPGRPGGSPPPPSGNCPVKAIAPTTARNSKPLWYPIHSTASEGSPPDQPRLGFRHSRRTLRNLQAGLRRISRRQPGDPTSAYTHLTVWAGRRDSESPPTSAP